MNFIFRNGIIFWDIPKWNKGQTKWDGGFCKKKSGTEVVFIINNLLFWYLWNILWLNLL